MVNREAPPSSYFKTSFLSYIAKLALLKELLNKKQYFSHVIYFYFLFVYVLCCCGNYDLVVVSQSMNWLLLVIDVIILVFLMLSIS